MLTADVSFVDTASGRTLFTIQGKAFRAERPTGGFDNELWYTIERVNQLIETELTAERR